MLSSSVLGRALAVAMLSLLLVLPVAAQETPTATPAPATMEELTMAEAEAMVAGYTAAFNAGDLKSMAAYIADNFAYEGRWEGGLLNMIRGKTPWMQEVAAAVQGGCTSLQDVISVEGNVAHVLEAWTCVSLNEAVTTFLVSLELTVEDGQYVALNEYFLDAGTALYGDRSDRETETAGLLNRLSQGKMDEVAEQLADDVTLVTSFDPLLGKGQTVKGKEAVLATLQEWVDAGVVYASTPWGHQAMRVLGHGRMVWPAWSEVMSVGLYTEDVIGYEGDLVNTIRINAKPEMTRVFKALLEAPQ